jgi:hypothetical protein
VSLERLVGILLVIVGLGIAPTAQGLAPAVSCSSVFIESLQEYRTVCSNGAYYTTRYRPFLKQWETDQLFPSGPSKALPLHRYPRPGAQQR